MRLEACLGRISNERYTKCDVFPANGTQKLVSAHCLPTYLRMIVLLRPSWPLLGVHNHSYSTYDRDLEAVGELIITCVLRMIVLFCPLGHSWGAHEHVYFTYDRALAALLANPAVSVIRMIVLLRLSWPLQGAHNHSYSTYDRDLGASGSSESLVLYV